LKSGPNPTKTNPSAMRIRKISRILKAMFLVYLFVLPLFVIVHSGTAAWNVSGQTYAKLSDMPATGKWIAAFAAVIFLSFAIVFYRLLNLYERGVIFTAQNVRLIRILGYLAFSNGLFGVIAPVLSAGVLSLTGLLFGIIASPWVIGGLFGIMISHIMDEGCKMQEEQELTV
jgi:hypothetical protein